jgi:CheY-like chemotaxis protein
VVKGSETLLLVDDEIDVLEIGRQLLRRLGYTVKAVSSGAEALQIYEAHPAAIDLVLLDMVMPGMGGGETFDRLRQINPAVKVLLASGYSLEGQAEQILARGCDGFIQKPFDISALSAKLRSLLDP